MKKFKGKHRTNASQRLRKEKKHLTKLQEVIESVGTKKKRLQAIEDIVLFGKIRNK